MAEVKFNKGSKEWQMFVDYWALCQKYWLVEDKDEYWSRMVDDFGAFTKKYDEDFFVIKLMWSFLNTQEKKFKDNK